MLSTVYVLDSTPLLTGYSPSMVTNQHYTTQEILEELGREEQLRMTIVRSWLQIREPARKSIKVVKEAAAETGDNLVLSSADLSILALSNEISEEGKKVTLMTDDYAVQNVASKLHIPFQNYVWKGIRRPITWELYCPTCRKTYNTQRRTCPNCGSTLKRRATQLKEKEPHIKS